MPGNVCRKGLKFPEIPGGKISIFPEVKEMDHYAQETYQECQEVQEACLGIQDMYN